MGGAKIAEPNAGRINSAEPVHSAIIHGEGCCYGNVVEVDSELGIVTPDCPREIVGELVALLCTLNIGVGFATEVSEAGNVHRSSGSSGRVRVKVGQSPARELKAEVIHLIVTDGPGIFCDYREVTIRLLRSARVGILSEGLILA